MTFTRFDDGAEINWSNIKKFVDRRRGDLHIWSFRNGNQQTYHESDVFADERDLVSQLLEVMDGEVFTDLSMNVLSGGRYAPDIEEVGPELFLVGGDRLVSTDTKLAADVYGVEAGGILRLYDGKREEAMITLPLNLFIGHLPHEDERINILTKDVEGIEALIRDNLPELKDVFGDLHRDKVVAVDLDLLKEKVEKMH